MTNHVLIIGPGYTASVCATRFEEAGFKVTIAARKEEVRGTWQQKGFDTLDIAKDEDWPDSLTQSLTHVLTSVAPPRTGNEGLPDPILLTHQKRLETCKALNWVGYLSSTIVYGDHQGKAVDETTPATPGQPRGHRRRKAEEAWEDFGEKTGVSVHLIRLAGIYGPGRNAFETILSGRARRIIKKGQVFSRIHVDDIAQIVLAAAKSGLKSGVFNGADTKPAPPQDVLEHASRLLHVSPPPAYDFETADMTPMARTFYSESKRVIANRLKDLGVALFYPTYEEGLAAILAEMEEN